MKNDKYEEFHRKMAGSTGKVLIYLMACALNDVTPNKNIYTKVEASMIYAAAKSHNVLSMAAYALEKSNYEGIPEGIAEKIKNEKNMAVRKSMLLNAERAAVTGFMEKEGIKYLPLKGIILQDMYPEFGMRQMADNDILYDEKYQLELKDFMISRGFDAKYVGVSVHDCYYKEPVYNFEMHTGLFQKEVHNGILAYYYSVDTIWDKAIKDVDKNYGYHFRDEDFYIYVTAHAEKHNHNSGTGIRTLTDFFVMNRAFTEADWTYIQNELNKLELLEFGEIMRGLAVKLLSDPKAMGNAFRSLNEKECKALRYMLSSGTYGTQENLIRNQLKKISDTNLSKPSESTNNKKKEDAGKISIKTKFLYYKKRLFPGRDFLYPAYPLAKYKITVPLVWIQRLAMAVTARRKRIFREFRLVLKQK